MITKADALLSLCPNAEWIVRGNTVEWKDTNEPEPSESEIQAKIAELTAAEPLRLLRQQRDQKLAQSDWMAVADRTMTPEQIAYRQSLRDMPANNPDVALNEAGELINVTWPTEPQ
jgi:hypothetical protein